MTAPGWEDNTHNNTALMRPLLPVSDEAGSASNAPADQTGLKCLELAQPPNHNASRQGGPRLALHSVRNKKTTACKQDLTWPLPLHSASAAAGCRLGLCVLQYRAVFNPSRSSSSPSAYLPPFESTSAKRHISAKVCVASRPMHTSHALTMASCPLHICWKVM